MDNAFWADVPLFAPLSVQERKALSEKFVRRDFQNGDILFKQGEQAQAMFLIESGQVNLTRRDLNGEQLLVTYGPKTLLGEVDLLLNQAYESTAMVDGLVEAWILTRHTLSSMMEAWPEINLKFRSVLEQPTINITHSSIQLQNKIDDTTGQIDLSSFPLFANLTPEDKLDVAQRMQVLHVAANEVIFSRGSFPDAFYLLKRGQLKLVKHGYFDVVRPGGFFGEMSLLTGQHRQVTAQAIEDCEILMLDRSQFEMVVRQYSTVSFVLSRTLSARLARANARIRPMPASSAPTTQPSTKQTKSPRRAKLWKQVILTLILLPLIWLAGLVAPAMLLNNTINNESSLPNDPPQIEVSPTVSPTVISNQ